MLAVAIFAMIFPNQGMAGDVPVADADQLRAAVLAADPGDKIIIAPGRYQTKLRFTEQNSGTEIAPVVVTARDGPGTVVLDGTGTGADITVKFTTAAYVRLEGLDITGGGYHGVFFSSGAHHISINGNRIYDNYTVQPMNSHAELKGSGTADNRPHQSGSLTASPLHPTCECECNACGCL